jgi:signal transduction histidine kinase
MTGNLLFKEILYCKHDTFSERKAMLLPAFTIHAYYIVLIYSYKIINFGISSINSIEYVSQLLISLSFLISIILSQKIKSNPVLSLPSIVFIMNSFVFLVIQNDVNIYIASYDWLFYQIIAILMVSFTGSTRCNVIVFLSCVLTPILAKLFNQNIQIASTYHDQSIIYFIAPITIYLSYLRAFQTIRHIQDLTKINELQKSSVINQKIINHQEKLASIGVLTASIAHEINNPLTVLAHSNKKLNESIKSDSPIDIELIEKHTEKIARSTERIQRIASGLKTYSAKEKQKKIFNLNLLLKDNIEFLSSFFKNADIEIVTWLDDNPVNMYGAEGEISQVVTNLISNAKDAIEESKNPIKRIDIETSMQGENIILQIKDTGKGIPEDIQDKIFDQFFSTKSSDKGLGLGMSITRNIVQDHKGDIKFTSSELGTTFILSFPQASSQDKPAD